MRITKAPQRKPSDPPLHVKNFIHTLETCPVEDLARHIDEFGDWNIHRSDLYLWVQVLNRFDVVLAELVKEGDFVHMQSITLTPSRRACLLAILKFTRLLLENCANRTLYASYEHLNDLLCSHDLIIVEHTLWILLRSAQRATLQRSTRISSSVSYERLLLLAQPLTMTDGLMTPLLSKDYIVADALSTVHFSFYRSRPISSTPLTTPETSSTMNDDDFSEGYIHLQISPEEIASASSTSELVSKLVKKHHIPYPPTALSSPSNTTSSSSSSSSSSLLNASTSMQQETSHPVFALHRKLIIASHMHSLRGREKLILTRILALATIVHIHSAEQSSKVLPRDLVSDLVEIMAYDAPYPWSLKAASIYALDGIALLREELQEVLVALNVSGSHGVLLSIVRRTVQFLTTSETPMVASYRDELEWMDMSSTSDPSQGTSLEPKPLSGEYFDALYTLLNYFMSLQNCGTLLMNAGLMTVLVQALDCLSPHLKYASKLINLIDINVYGFPNGFTIVCNCQGLTKLIQRIQSEVSYLYSSPMESEDFNLDRRVLWVKALLKFTLHMMQIGSGPEIRNLIDSSLPMSLLTIFQSMKHTPLVSLAINIMSNFIHGEPTSLSILQEMKLPQTLIDQVSVHLPLSTDLISTLPNAFGAICLNPSGLEYFSQSNALASFLNMFLSPDHLPLLVDNDNASMLGSGMDELLRHQPSLRSKFMDLLLPLLTKFIEQGQQAPASAPLVLPTHPVPFLSTPTEITLAMDAISKFLDCLLQSNAHSKEFLARNGLPLLLQCFSFPCLTYDFPSTLSRFSLLHLFHVLCETDPKLCSQVILTTLRTALHAWQPLDLSLALHPNSEEVVRKLNYQVSQLTHLLGLLKLIREVFSPPSWPKRHPTLLLKELSDSFGMEGLQKLAHLHQSCLTQLITLRQTVAPQFFNEPKLKKHSSSIWMSTSSSTTTTATATASATNAATSTTTLPTSTNLTVDPTVPSISASSSSTTPSLGDSASLTAPPPAPVPTAQPGFDSTHDTTATATTSSTSALVNGTPGASESTSFLPTSFSLSSSASPSSFFTNSNNGSATFILSAWGVPLLDEPLPCTEPIDETHYLFINCRCLRTLFNQLHLSIVPLFHGIARMLTCKKNAEPSVKQVNRFLGKSLVQVGLTYMHEDLMKLGKEYEKQVLGLANLMLLDERNSSSLQTGLLYYAFELDWVSKLAPTDDSTMLELFLHMLLTMCHAKQIHDSSFGVALFELPGFESAYLLQKARLFTIHYLQANLDLIVQKTSCKTLLKIFIYLLKAEGESPPASSSSSLTSRARVGPIDEILGSDMVSLLRSVAMPLQPTRPVVPDPANIAILTDMGFTQAVAQMALERCHNNVERAAEYILTHPELEFQAAAASSSSSSTSSTTSSTQASTSGDMSSLTTAASSSTNDTTTAPSLLMDTSHEGQPPTELMNTSSNEEESTNPFTEAPSSVDAIDLDLSSPMLTDPPHPLSPSSIPSSSFTTTTSASTSSTLEPSFLNGSELESLLQEARTEFQKQILPLIVPILSKHEELMMDFKDVVFLLKSNESLSYLFQHLNDHLPIFLTLIALLFTDSSKHRTMLNHVLEHQSTFLDIFLKPTSLAPMDVGPIWIPLLLIFEGLLNYVDEPESMETPKVVNDEIKLAAMNTELKQKVQAVFTPSILPTLVEQLAKFLELLPEKASPSSSSSSSSSSTTAVSSTSAASLKDTASSVSSKKMSPISQEKLTKKVTDSVLRILVRFTRHSELCHRFTKATASSPVSLLIKCESLHYVIMILRHIVEHSHPTVLPFVICNEIKKSVVKSTALYTGFNRDLDINTLIKTCSHASLRDTSLFLETAEKLFTASKPEIHSRNLSLKWITPIYQSPSTPLTISTVVEDLVQRLLTLKNLEDLDGENHIHSTRIFLMKMTSELVLSYTPCKLALLDPLPMSPTVTSTPPASSSSSSSASSKRHSLTPASSMTSPTSTSFSSSTSPTVSSKPTLSMKSAYIHYLVEKVLPWPGVHTQNDLSSTIRKKLFESQWASTILSCLCTNPDGDEAEKDPNAPIHWVRKVVVNAVHKAMVTPFEGPVSARYGRYLALADTVHRMLSVPSKRKTLSGGSSANAHAAEVVPIALVKCFLEKQFVALLTEMLSNIDTHHPQAKFIVTSILKPIEFLTKLSVKMSQVKFSSNILVTPETPARPSSTSTEASSRDAAEDALRHSSLGIMEGQDDVSMREEEHDDDEDDDEDDEEDGPESYNELSTVELSEASELSEEEEEEDGLDLDMEIVIQPNHPHELLAEQEEEESQDARSRPRHLHRMLHSSHQDSSDSGDDDIDDEEDESDDDDDDDENHSGEEDDALDESDAMDLDYDDDGHYDDQESHYSLSSFSGPEVDMEELEHGHDGQEDTGNTQNDLPDHPPHSQGAGNSEEHEQHHDSNEDAEEMESSSEDDEDDDDDDDDESEDDEEQVDVLNDPFDEFELELELPQIEDGSHPLDFRRSMHDGHEQDYDDEEGEDVDEEGLDMPEDDYLMHAGHEWFQAITPHHSSMANSRRMLMADPGRFHQDLLHPLLSSNRNNGHLLLSLPAPLDRGQLNLDAHQIGAAMEQILGGGAMQLLEQLFARTPHAGSLEIQVNNELFPDRRIVINNNDPIVNDFKPLLTQERWRFESQLLFGISVPEKNSRIGAHLLKIFLPQVLQLKRAKDEADKLQKEKEAKVVPERTQLTTATKANGMTEQEETLEPMNLDHPSTSDEPLETAATETASLPSAASSSEQEPPSTALSSTEAPSSALTPLTSSSQSYIVNINGMQYDLTNSGIDPTFIEALPEELRLEVIQQYILETDTVQPLSMPPLASSPLSSSSSASSSSSTSTSMHSPTTVASSSSTVQAQPRRSVSSTSARTTDTEILYSPSISDNDPSTSIFTPGRSALSTLDASIDAVTNGQDKSLAPSNISISIPKKKDALHLLDRSHVSTLVGLLFTETPFVKTNLQKLLLSLCENTKTRNDLISLLMQILIQGLDQVHLELQSIDRLSPSTVTERCLEMLVFLVRQSPSISQYFVQSKKNSPPIFDLIELLKSTDYVEDLIELLSVIAQNSINQPIVLPKPAIISLFHVLEGECPLKTFQHLLVVIQSLSNTCFDGFVEVLLHSIHQTKDALSNALTLLHATLTSAQPDENVLKTFSHPASKQATLLRLLKTLDYLVMKQKKSMPPVELANIWTQLSECLKDIGSREELVSVLLPLIEAFMVVEAQTHDPSFNEFTENHRKLLNFLVRNNPSLLSGSFSILVNNPKVLEFDNKRNYFYQQLNAQKPRRHNIGTLQLNVRRQFVFEDSFHQLQHKSGEEIKYGKLVVRFYDEEGVDAGGLTREWFSVLARQIFNPDYALFKTSAVDKVTYQPNRASWVNPEHLRFFKFVGRFIGKAIYDQRLLDSYFTRSFYKHMLGKPVDIRDMEAVDPSYYKSLDWILENEINDIIDLTFSVETEDFGRTKIVDLKENGRNIPVTDENKQEYVQLAVEQKLTKAIQEPIAAFLSGLQEIIPKDLLRIFNEHELELLISGMPEIDVDDWKNNTEYRNYSSSSPVIQWFWRAVRSFDQEQRAKLVQYCTGTSKVPLEGFKALQGSSGVQKFLIVKDPGGTHRLPSSHTCFNQLDLPEYESYEQLRSMILKAIDVASEGFGIS